MSAASTLESRLEQVEQDVAHLKSQVQTLQPPGNWLEAMTGAFKDDPEFDEILRLGKAQRDADRPQEG
jgi:hypothetical protein